MAQKTPSKQTKINKYRQALMDKQSNPARHWTDITRSLGIGNYPFIGNFDVLTDNALDSISAVYNLVYGNDEVAVAFKQVISKRFGLVDPETMREENLLNFRLASVDDHELIEQVENRKLYKAEDGKWHKKVMKQIEADEII